MDGAWLSVEDDQAEIARSVSTPAHFAVLKLRVESLKYKFGCKTIPFHVSPRSVCDQCFPGIPQVQQAEHQDSVSLRLVSGVAATYARGSSGASTWSSDHIRVFSLLVPWRRCWVLSNPIRWKEGLESSADHRVGTWAGRGREAPHSVNRCDAELSWLTHSVTSMKSIKRDLSKKNGTFHIVIFRPFEIREPFFNRLSFSLNR